MIFILGLLAIFILLAFWDQRVNRDWYKTDNTGYVMLPYVTFFVKPIRELKVVWLEEKEFNISDVLNGQVKEFQQEVRKEMLEWWNSLSAEAQNSIRKSFKKGTR